LSSTRIVTFQAQLTGGFEQSNSHRGRKIQTPDTTPINGQVHHTLAMGCQHFFRQTLRFRTKNQAIPTAKAELVIGPLSARGKENKAAPRQALTQSFPPGVHFQLHMGPIVQTSAFEVATGELES
jgi:hypothetical protein